MRKIAPWGAGTQYPQHGLDKEPVICGTAARICSFAGQHMFNSFPLVVLKFVTFHDQNIFHVLSDVSKQMTTKALNEQEIALR